MGFIILFSFLVLIQNFETHPVEYGPSFIIIGCGSGGTSSLHFNLDQHPDIFSARDYDNVVIRNDIWLEGRKEEGKKGQKVASRKEMNFFNMNYLKGIDHYESIFKETSETLTLQRKDDDPPLLLFEKTPSYLCNPTVPERIHQHYPDMKFVAVLRNPVDRIYSEMNRRFDKGQYSCDVVRKGEEDCVHKDELVKADKFMMKQYVEKKIEKVLASPPTFQKYCLYPKHGLYYEQLQVWFEYFDREQFLIIRSEDYFEDSNEVFDEILRFLNVSREYRKKKLKVKNQRDYLPMSNEVRRKLMSYYEEPNRLLYQLLGRDMGWEKLNEEKLQEGKIDGNCGEEDHLLLDL